MRYKVPQNVQREDRILWFITLRQMVFLLVGFGISYVMLTKMKAKYNLDMGDQLLIWTPAAFSACLAFLKIKGIPLIQFMTLLLENLIFRKSRRYWIQNAGEPFVSMITHVEPLHKKEKKNTTQKAFDRKKAKALAEFLDAQGEKNQKQFVQS